MSTPFLGEIKIISWNYAPKSWAFCNGQFLPINQNQPLFSLLGTMYGGNGQTTFARPDFRGNVPLHVGSGFTQGQVGGEPAHTLTQNETPQHIHFFNSRNVVATATTPSNTTVIANSPSNAYVPQGPLAPMAGNLVSFVGGSQAHQNQQPYLVLNFIIALQGIFPSRN